ncbi:MAG: MoxR family ATPase [Lachnospiraceae bacterium]|nr:MoxR family ATPase [Lachnospiraceae bacterium]
MKDMLAFLREEGITPELIAGVESYRAENPVTEDDLKDRVPEPEYLFYGKDIWERALAALLAGENLLLTGPKATGKNVLAENLAFVFGRPSWNVSFHISTEASYLIGQDTYDGTRVVFREGPIYLTAEHGGFVVLDEINMARNEALAVLHSALDFRHIIDVPGYRKVHVKPAARFIATMNYGYAGTRDLNAALASRFAILNMPVISEDDLRKLLMNRFPALRPEICEQLMKLFYELEKKAAHADISDRAVDLRGLLDAVRLIEKGLMSGDALDMCIVGKTFDPFEQNLVRDVVNARIPSDLTKDLVFSS